MGKKILIKNGKIVDVVKGTIIDGGEVLIDDRKIVSVGENIDTDEQTESIDVKGGYVIPGIIDAHCHIGIFETGMGVEGDDGNETSDPVTLQLRAIDGIYPFDDEFSHALRHGVTCVATGPGSANPIAGQFVAMKTAGRIMDTMVIKDPLAMKVAFGENPKKAYGGSGKNPVTRMATAALIREWLYKAKEYAYKKDRANELDDRDKMPPFDIKLEALESVIRKEIPIKAHAHRADDIMTALRIAKELDVDITLEHCTEGHLIAKELAAYNKGVVLGPLNVFPSKPEVKNMSLEAPAILFDAGVNVAIMTDLPATHVGHLPIAVGMCMANGLKEMDAFRSVSLNPAKILNLDKQMGSIDSGKDANIAVFTSHPFLDIQSRCVMTIIEGDICHRKGI